VRPRTCRARPTLGDDGAVSRPRVVLFAYHTLGVRCLEVLERAGCDVALVVTHADDPGETRWFESVADAARGRGLPVLTPASPSPPDLAARLRELAPALVVSAMYRRLLSASILAIPSVAAVNLHPSYLPRYRGRAPVNWVLVNGETETGVTLHDMTPAADAGDVIAQDRVPIAPDDTAASLFRRIDVAGAALFARALPAVLAGTAPRTPQDPAQATIYGRRRPEDGRVDWGWPAARIANMIRAVTHPFPGAFAGDGAARLHLWAGAPAAGAGPAAAPGTIVDVAPGRGVAVATGQGTLCLRRVQPAGGDEDDAWTWAARRGLRPGASVREGP
jgi:methionyl-tRNA formyltransferase